MADRECEQRVAKMEEVYNRCAAGTRALQEALQGWEGNLNDFFALMEYYGSEEWYKDREACAACWGRTRCTTCTAICAGLRWTCWRRRCGGFARRVEWVAGGFW